MKSFHDHDHDISDNLIIYNIDQAGWWGPWTRCSRGWQEVLMEGEALQQHATGAWQFWDHNLGAPRWISAPMVLQSELPFR